MNSKPRLLWPDAAKGFSIILVVLTHLTSKHYAILNLEVPGEVHLFWLGFSDFLMPVRMPLFFAISGLFIAKYLESQWSVVTKRRIIAPYYLYLVWYLIQSIFFYFDPPLITNLPSTTLEWGLGMAWGYTSLWYLYALPVYFLICKVFANQKMPALIGAGILAVLSDTTLIPQIGNGSSVLGNLIFFMGAAYFPQLISRAAEKPQHNFGKLIGAFIILSSTASLVTYVVLKGGYRTLPIDLVMGASDIILGGLGIVVGVKIFSFMALKFRQMAKFFAYIGKNTLPIYVMHLCVLAALNIFLINVSMPLVIALIYPFVALVFVVAICLGIYHVLLFLRLNWLFKMPEFASFPQEKTHKTPAPK